MKRNHVKKEYIFFGCKFSGKLQRLVEKLVSFVLKRGTKFLLGKTMPHNQVSDPKRVEDLVLGGGLMPSTLKKREHAFTAFDTFVKSQYKITADDAIKSERLEEFLMAYFSSVKVQQKDSTGELVDMIPKQRTMDALKSNLKLAILQKTENKIDILNKIQFPNLGRLVKGVQKDIKKQGRGETDHKRPMGKNDLSKIFKFITQITKLFQARGTEEFSTLLKEIPMEYRNDYHRLLQWSVQFVLSLFDIRRGREGLDELKVQHYIKQHNQELKMDYYMKAMGEQTKNHKTDSEDLSNAGIIPCVENSYGTNPGLVLDIYLSHLNQNCEFLFQRPQRPSKGFHLDVDQVLYEKTKVGVNQTGKMVPKLCELVGIKTNYTNHCLRPTGILLLKEAGYSDRDIIKLTGHKNEASLSNYDPANNLDKKAQMADALLLAGGKRKSDASSDDTSEKENTPPPRKVTLVETAVALPGSSVQIEEQNTADLSFQQNTADQSFQKYLFREQELRAAESRRSFELQNQVIKMNNILMDKFM